MINADNYTSGELIGMLVREPDEMRRHELAFLLSIRIALDEYKASVAFIARSPSDRVVQG